MGTVQQRTGKPGDATMGWGALTSLVGFAVIVVAVALTPDAPYAEPPALVAGIGRLLFTGGFVIIGVGLLMRLVHHASR